MSPEDAASAAKLLPGPIPIKRLLRTLRIAASAERFDAISAAAGDPGGAAKPRGGDGDGEAAAFSAPLTVFGLKSYLEAVRSVGSSPHGLYQHQVSGHTTSAAGGSPTIWVPSGSAGDK